MQKVANLVFNPFRNDSRVEKISKSLVHNGYEVEVIAHLDKDVEKEEIRDNYKIKRFSYLDRKVTKSKFGKLKAYLIYTKEVVNYCKNFDIIHCNDLNTLPIGVIIKKFFNKNVKIVYDAHEHESERCHQSKFLNKLSRIVEKNLIKYVDTVITVSNLIAIDYQKIYNIDKPKLVLNTPPYKDIKKKNIFRQKFNISENTRIFLFQGLISEGRGIEIILEVFRELFVSGNSRGVIIFMGYGPLVYKIEEYSKKFSNIFYHPAVDSNVLLDYTSSADFGVHMAQGHCLSYLYALPNKTFEYIMAELPIIVTNLPELGKLVTNDNVGILIEENTKESLKDVIIKAINLDKIQYQELIDNVRKAKKKYCWEEQEKILINTYKEVLDVNKI